MALTPRGRIKEAERRQEIRQFLDKIDQPLTPPGIAPSQVDQVANTLERERAKGVPINQSTFQNGLGDEILTPVQKFSMMPNIRLGIDLSRYLDASSNPVGGNGISSFDATVTTASGTRTVILIPGLQNQYMVVVGLHIAMRSATGIDDTAKVLVQQLTIPGGVASTLGGLFFIRETGAQTILNHEFGRRILPPGNALRMQITSGLVGGSLNVIASANVYMMQRGVIPHF